LLPQRHASTWLLSLSTLMAVGGMSFAVYSVLWLGRSFSLMPEARRLVTGGPYSVIRHPLYVGEGLPMIGFVIANFSGLAFWVLVRDLPFSQPRPFARGYLSVDVFFVLSGFVLAFAFGGKLAANMTLYEFMKARVRRLGPVLLFGSLLGAVGVIIQGTVPANVL